MSFTTTNMFAPRIWGYDFTAPRARILTPAPGVSAGADLDIVGLVTGTPAPTAWTLEYAPVDLVDPYDLGAADAAEAADDEQRNRIAYHMFRAWYVPFYRYGVIHGDPHLGNYTVRADDSINLLDFGAVRVFRPNFVKGVIDLYWALQRDDRDLRARSRQRRAVRGPGPRARSW